MEGGTSMVLLDLFLILLTISVLIFLVGLVLTWLLTRPLLIHAATYLYSRMQSFVVRLWSIPQSGQQFWRRRVKSSTKRQGYYFLLAQRTQDPLIALLMEAPLESVSITEIFLSTPSRLYWISTL